MLVKYLTVVLVLTSSLVLCEECYHNSQCNYDLFGSKTPYESIRGDIRDAKQLPGCKVVGVWSLHRHGNRNPGSSVTVNMKTLYDKLIVEIKKQFEEKTNVLCIQDIEDCVTSIWNSTLQTSFSHLSATGYEELYDIGKRVRQAFPSVFSFSNDSFYFRPTNEQRTITSAIAYVHGLTDGTGMDLSNNIQEPLGRDDVIRPYANCTIYLEGVRGGPALAGEVDDFDTGSDLLAVTQRVQKRLNTIYQISPPEVIYLYEYCRFHRSWAKTYKDPWCAVFSEEDLKVLEYRDDMRHYHRNGYGSRINVNLGAGPLKNLYESFASLAANDSEKFIAYFTHDTIMEMTTCALGLYKEPAPLRGSHITENRVWRTSHIGAFAVNYIAVLYKCESSEHTYRVQFFHNEKVTSICPEEGCTWDQFVDKFKIYSDPNVEICSDNEYEFHRTNSAHVISVMNLLLLVTSLISFKFC